MQRPTPGGPRQPTDRGRSTPGSMVRRGTIGGLVLSMAIVVGLAACGSAGRTAASPGSEPADGGTEMAPDPTLVASAPPTTVDPGTLPQTRDHPSTDGTGFSDGEQALWQAIVTDDPSVALPFFFPLSAYLQVKDVTNPQADWQNRLVGAFGRDIHRLHQQLGANAAQARLVGLDVPGGQATWVDPGHEHNKIGYWRVYGSSLRYQVGGSTASMPIYSLISWRGEWYVVHVGPP